MEDIGFVRGRRQRTKRNRKQKTTEESKEIVLYSNEEATPLSSVPYKATESERDDSGIIPSVPAVKASQLFKNSCRPAVYVRNVWKMGFNTQHTELIRRTPFGAFVDMQMFSVDGRLLSDIIRCHNGGEEFVFCGKAVLFSADEVALILGLPAQGKKIDTSCQLFKGRLFRRFGHGLDLHQKGLEKLIDGLQSSKIQEDIEDTVRLWIAYMFAMFLAPKSNQTCPRYLIQHLDDLTQLERIDWASAFKELILLALPEVSACLRSEQPVHSRRANMVRRQPTLFGCSAALVAWFLEHTSKRAPAYPNKLPRLLKWYDSQMKFRSIRVANIQPDDLLEEAIIPLSQERWLLSPQTVATPEPIDSCASCVELRNELGLVKNELKDVKHRLAMAESLLSSLLRKESNATNEQDKREEKTEECPTEPANANTEEEKGHSLDNQTEPGIGNKEDDKRAELHSTAGQEEINSGQIIVSPAPSDNTLIKTAPSEDIIVTPAPKAEDGDKIISGLPSLIKRVKKEPRRRKASKITGDSYETARPRKSQKTVGTSKAETTIEDEQIIIQNFLSEKAPDEIVYTNKFGGPITRKSVLDLINKEMIIDDIIDAGQEFLMRTWAEHPDLYHKCLYSSVMTAGLCLTSESSPNELAGTAGIAIFDEVTDEEKGQFRFLFTIINSDNAHWHLVAVDMTRKVFMHLNSLKRNARYRANAKKWQNILGHIFHIYCDKEEVMTWPMEEISDCPSQPAGSLDCGLYCLKFMDCLARRDNADMKMDFTDDEIRVYRRQLAASIVREGLNRKIEDITRKIM